MADKDPPPKARAFSDDVKSALSSESAFASPSFARVALTPPCFGALIDAIVHRLVEKGRWRNASRRRRTDCDRLGDERRDLVRSVALACALLRWREHKPFALHRGCSLCAPLSGPLAPPAARNRRRMLVCSLLRSNGRADGSGVG